MSISVTGLGSGLDYDSWIEKLVAVKQGKIDAVSKEATAIGTKKTTLGTIEDKYQALSDSIDTFTGALSLTDVFNQKTVKSSLDAVSAKVTAGASVQNVNVTVSELATSTIAKSATPAASYVDSNTLMSSVSEGAFKAGTFSLYVDGAKSTISIASGETMDSVLTKLNGISGVNASLTDGKLSISAKSGYTLTSAGSSSDTSNFSNLMSLTRDSSTGAYSSSKSIFDTNTGLALTSTEFAKGAITTGDFMIGDKTFTVGANSTLDSIIAQINESDCGASASWDPNAGKLVLTATDEGAVSINITAGDGTVGASNASNFTDIMGLTSSTWDVDGKLTSTELTTDSQDLGTNAILTINGTTITSSSNTVTSDISGIAGLTLTLNDKTTSAAKVSVAQDTEEVVKAITSFVSAFNMAISESDNATATDGKLHGESLLSSLRDSIRRSATAATSVDGIYKTLASIGITTGSFTTDTSAETNKLTIDTEALTKALTTDPESVKKLLIGDGVHDGVMTKMTPVLDNALNLTNGYFTKREASLSKEAATLNKKVTTMTESLERYHEQLSAKFQAMDELISSLKSSASVFDSYFNKDTSSDSK